MKVLNLAELLRHLQAGQIAQVYLLLGDDLPGRDRALAALRTAVCPGDLLAWNLQEIDGETATGARVMAMAHTPPFLGERRLLIVNKYADMPLAEQEQMLPLLEAPPSFCVSVLVAQSLDKRTKNAQAVLKKAAVVELSGPVAGNAIAWVSDLARTMEIRIEPKAIPVLVEKAGTDAGFLARELEKLAIYAGADAAVTVKDVLALAAEGEPELALYSGLRMAEAVAVGDVTPALQILADMLAAGEAPLRILGSIIYQYRLLLAAKAWAREGPAQAASSLGISAFPMQKAFGLAGRLDGRVIAAGMEDILQADIALKRGSEPVVTLQSLLIKLATRKTPDSNDGQ